MSVARGTWCLWGAIGCGTEEGGSLELWGASSPGSASEIELQDSLQMMLSGFQTPQELHLAYMHMYLYLFYFILLFVQELPPVGFFCRVLGRQLSLNTRLQVACM